MTSSRQLKLHHKGLTRQSEVIEELTRLVKDIERCERTIVELKSELEEVNVKFQKRVSTREEIDYLTALLKVANKKLVWEKNMASLQKRTPEIMNKVSQLVNDPKSPLEDVEKASLAPSLNAVQAAMQRLAAAKME
jgi:hypothetical protein